MIIEIDPHHLDVAGDAARRATAALADIASGWSDKVVAGTRDLQTALGQMAGFINGCKVAAEKTASDA